MYSKSVGCDNIPFKEDDWANVGPGAIEGIRMMFPSTKGRKAIYDRMAQLRDEQEKYFNELGIKFNYYEKFTKGHISLRVLEHMCCEFQKLWLQKRGLGKQRMIFSENNNRIITKIENGKEIKYRLVLDDTGEKLVI